MWTLLGRWNGLPWSVVCDEVPAEKKAGVLGGFQIIMGDGWEFHWEVC